MEVRHLPPEDVTLLGSIDRSERVTIGYSFVDDELTARDVAWNVPSWNPEGTGDHTVHDIVTWTRSILDRGAVLLGAFEGDQLMGLCVVHPTFEKDLAWLTLLHVSRPHRRRGTATALWDEAVRLSREANRSRMYVSSAPSGSAVGFYLARGCVLARPPHPDLFAYEPDDIHLVVDVTG